jgi:hypothetical protein
VNNTKDKIKHRTPKRKRTDKEKSKKSGHAEDSA